MRTEIWAIGLVILGTIIGSFAPLLLKLGVKEIKLTIKNFIFNQKILAGLFLYFLSSLIFVYALKGGELSVLYPFVSFGYIWVTIHSKVFLKEKINRFKIIGIIFIIIGVALISSQN